MPLHLLPLNNGNDSGGGDLRAMCATEVERQGGGEVLTAVRGERRLWQSVLQLQGSFHGSTARVEAAMFEQWRQCGGRVGGLT